MIHLGDVMTHLRLVLRMGHVTGTDIVSAHGEGRLSQEDWARMIKNCRGCDWAQQCPDWLESQDTITTAPRNCPNRARFKALKSGKD